MSKCWICGENALTREHIPKASEIKVEFPEFPIYKHTDVKRNQKIQGIKSKLLKPGDKTICAKCNNQHTQLHDLTWDKFLSFFQKRKQPIKSGDHIKLQKIFPGAIHRSMLNIHLYFAKLLGCGIKEAMPDIELTTFANAILKNKPLDNFYIAFCPTITGCMGRSNLETTRDNYKNCIVYAAQIYEHATFSTRAIYADSGQKNRTQGLQVWHPTTIHKILCIGPTGT